MEFIAQNVVVTANQFNPSIFTQPWLSRNGVILDDEVLPNAVFQTEFCQVVATHFTLLVLPTALQIHLQTDVADSGVLVRDRVSRVVRVLPQTPYVAIGLNFIWNAASENETIEQLSRRLFFLDHPPFNHFNVDNAKFGSYMSRNFADSVRLKLDIKPVVSKEDNQVHRLQFTFNFHRDISGDHPVQDIEELLNLWERAKDASRTIVAESIRGAGCHDNGN